jgi:(E)-4-hydroxy-3-methylbut-2-enyl-diphosphate synthase
MQYTEAIYQTVRRKTREVKVGNLGIGGNNPIRIQSMTTSDTKNEQETADQIMRLADVGCELVRVTVQGKKEAKACEKIKNLLTQKGYHIPLVADIHFYPPAAMEVVEFVDKVRINPGNFADRRATFRSISYDDQTYQDELNKIEEVFAPLVEKCIKLKKAIRIGTNHGSLSDRIMSRYGDTPFGMVESALEFARICRKQGFHHFLFSMKASHPLVMIQAYRLLVAEMIKLGWDYPLHLGVTEAGEGEDGRVKSAVGIGSLLLDGLGDTIRVSLTEAPWEEVDPCKRLITVANRYKGKGMIPFVETKRDICQIQRRFCREEPSLHRDGSVILHFSQTSQDFGHKKRKADALYLEEYVPFSATDEITILTRTPGIEKTVLVKDLSEINEDGNVVWIKDGDPSTWSRLLHFSVRFILLEMTGSVLHQGRYFFEWIQQAKLDIPVILVGTYQGDYEQIIIEASSELGALLSDGFGEGVLLRTPLSQSQNRSLSFNLLQACRMRASKTEFIACPGCGRTLFDLQDVTKRIRSKVDHLPGVKIAIMGCIVNGPGEMADADFGYVGSKSGKVDLYVGKTCVERNIDFCDADERLIQLIKDQGRWVDKDEVSSAISATSC